MKTNKYFRILRYLARDLGDENLTVSIAYSNNNFFVSVSTHTSEKFEFDHGGYQRTVQITKKDLDKESRQIHEELVNIYNKLLKPKKGDADAPE